MQKSDRIRASREILDRLKEEGVPVIEMHFHQVGIDTNDYWNGDRESFIAQVLKNASDEQLIEILNSFTAPAGIDSTEEHPDLWERDLFRLFISHKSEDKNEVAHLSRNLRYCGISGFVAHESITPSTEWLQQIVLALKTCDGLLAFLTENFRKSDWTDHEVGYAIAREVQIIPLSINRHLPYGMLGKFQALICNGNPCESETAIEIMKLALKRSNRNRSIPDAIISSLQTSESYTDSTLYMKALENVPLLDNSQLDRLKKAFYSNKQFSGVTRMPTRVAAIFTKSGQKL